MCIFTRHSTTKWGEKPKTCRSWWQLCFCCVSFCSLWSTKWPTPHNYVCKAGSLKPEVNFLVIFLIKITVRFESHVTHFPFMSTPRMGNIKKIEEGFFWIHSMYECTFFSWTFSLKQFVQNFFFSINLTAYTDVNKFNSSFRAKLE